MCTINQDHMHPWYDVWFLIYEVQRTINQDHMHPWYDEWFLRYEVPQNYFVILTNVLLFHPPNNPKNDNI